MLHPSWEARPALIRLAVAMSHQADPVRRSAYSVIDAIQALPAKLQIEAVFAAAVILANAIGEDPHDLVSRARRQVPDLEFSESSIQAISDYAKGELQ